jgi:hypothetical protein
MPTSKVLLPLMTSQTHNFTGIPARVRVQDVMRGPKRKIILLYYRKVRELCWDPGRLQWPGKVQFMHYSTKLGRKLLRKRHPPLQLATRKWNQTLPADFRFRWTNVWDHERQKKEADLMWQIWHKAVAVNIWRGRISPNIDVSCSVCGLNQDETILHRFWDCYVSQQVWGSITCLLNYLAFPNLALDWSMPDWKQTIFAKRPPRKFRKVSRYWTLLKGIAVWTIWLARNDSSFNNVQWDQEKIKQVMWQEFCDYRHSAWSKTQENVRKDPTSVEAALAQFDAQWLWPAICTRDDMKIRWVRTWPTGIG